MVHSCLPKEKQTEFKLKIVIILKTREHVMAVQHQKQISPTTQKFHWLFA